jgi:hypothetical protein
LSNSEVAPRNHLTAGFDSTKNVFLTSIGLAEGFPGFIVTGYQAAAGQKSLLFSLAVARQIDLISFCSCLFLKNSHLAQPELLTFCRHGVRRTSMRKQIQVCLVDSFTCSERKKSVQ